MTDTRMKVGDKVIVTGGYGNREPRGGVVVNVRRKYAGVEVPWGATHVQVIDFDRETGRQRLGPNDSAHYALHARTPEQFAYDERIATAERTLLNAGLTWRHHRRSVSDETLLALAAVIEEAL